MNSRATVGPPVWWVLWAVAAVVVRLLSQGILEAGDGVNHYQIARFSWDHPELFLDHWGKPLFTLFASPFAQLGHWGVTLFNALCFVATCWAADGLLRRAGPLARWLYAPALLLAPVYGTMVLAGMTEIFFGLLAVLVLRALADQRHVLAAVIASFMPFARPEYVVFAPMVLLWLVWHRQWRALPWLLTGHLIYGMAGAAVLGDFLWYFHMDPYTGAADIYGSGDLWHFWERRKHILGSPLLCSFALALPLAALLWWRKAEERPMLRLLLVGLLPALGIAALHSILWWKGLKGSLGLERVLATTVPLLALFTVWVLGRSLSLVLRPGWRLGIASALVGIPYIVHAARFFQWEQAIPVPANAEQEFLDRAGAEVATMPEPQGRTIIFHPFITYRSGIDPFDTLRTMPYVPGGKRLRPSDRLVWDAHFGPNEMGLPLEELMSDSTLRLMATLVRTEHNMGQHDRVMEVHIFERGPGKRWQRSDTLLRGSSIKALSFRMDTIACGGGALCIADGEFPLEFVGLPVEEAGMRFADLIITGNIHWPDGHGELQLVFSEDGTDGPLGYRSMHLAEGSFEQRFRLPPHPPGSTNKLYMWNISRKPFMWRDPLVRVERTFQEDQAP